MQLQIEENNLKLADIRLNTLKTLKPRTESATEMPVLPVPTEETPELPSYSESDITPDEPSIPVPEIPLVSTVNTDTVPMSGDGTEISPYVFFVSQNSVVEKNYMVYLADSENISTATSPTEETLPVNTPRCAVFNVCDDNGKVLYSWLVKGSDIRTRYQKDWSPSEGIEITEDGSIKAKQNVNPFATLLTYGSPSGTTVDYPAYTDENNNGNITTENEDMSSFINNYLQNMQGNPPEITDYIENPDNLNTPDNPENTDEELRDGIYTADEIKTMKETAEQQKTDITMRKKNIEVELKNTRNMLKSGSETAVIDGTVTFVASSDKQAEKLGYYMMIANENSTSVVTQLPEKDLAKISVGTKADINYQTTDENGTMQNFTCMATVTDISDELSDNVSENNLNLQDGYDDDNFHDVTLILEKGIRVNEDNDLDITFQPLEDMNDKSVYLPSYFIRSEGKKKYVLWANAQDILEKRYIEVGQTGDIFEITSGLSRTDRIALPYGKAVEGASTITVNYELIESNNTFGLF